MNNTFSYTVALNFDTEVFYKTCKTIEARVPGILKKDFSEDMLDGSLYQSYQIPSGTIKVSCDFMIDAVFVDSELNLDNILAFLV